MNYNNCFLVPAKELKAMDSNLEFEENIILPSYKIKILNLFSFRVKHETDSVRMIFNETENEVILKGRSSDELNKVKRKMYECLDAVVSDEITLSEKRCEFLSRAQVIDYLQRKSKAENMSVLYQNNPKRKYIRCYSFSEKEVYKGIQFVEDEITHLNVNLKMAQRKCLKSSTWVSLMKTLDTGLTSVYQEENDESIVVESLEECQAIETKDKIVGYLDDHVKSRLAIIILESSKARCFQARLQDKLRRKIQSEATFEVVVLSDDPLNLEVSVEGEESIVNELYEVEQQIWQESVDISSISSEVQDAWLIMKGLCYLPGKEFLTKFEQTYGCFIEMPDIEENSDLNTGSSSEDVFECGDIAQANPNVFTRSATEMLATAPKTQNNARKERHYRKGPFDRYQSGLSEDDALQLALLLSVESAHSSDEKEKEHPQDDDETILVEDEDSKYKDESNFKPDLVFSENYRHRNDAIQQEDRREHSNHSSSIFDSGMKGRNLFMYKTTVKLIQGHIAKQRADALVNVISSSDDPFDGAVSKMFLGEGGQLLSQMYESVSSTSDCVVVTGWSGKLKCSTVFHVKMDNTVPYKKMIGRAIANAFAECENWECKSVAFPPLGIDGVSQYVAYDVAETMVTEIGLQLQSGNSSVKQVLIVISDDDTYATFDEAFQTFKQSSVYVNQGSCRHKPDSTRSDKREKSSRVLPDTQQVRTDNSYSASRTRRSEERFGFKMFNTSKCEPVISVPENIAPYQRRSKSRGGSYQNRLRKQPAKYRQCWDRADSSVSEKHIRSEVLYDRTDTDIHLKCNSRNKQDLKVKITAESKTMCLEAKYAFQRRVKDEFLHEEIIEKKYKMSDKTKTRILKISSDNDVQFLEGNGFYTIKGREGRVRKTHTEILKVLLNEKSVLTEETKQNHRAERATREYIRAMRLAEPEVPNYWKNHKSGISLGTLIASTKHFIKGTKFEKVDLIHNLHAFSTIVKLINATFDPSLVGKGKDAEGLDSFNYKKLFVLKIERIENLDLFEQFSRRKVALYRKLYQAGDVKFPTIEEFPNCSGGISTDRYVHPALDKDLHPEINEYLLFHGTKEENVLTISNDGLDPRISSGNAMFGPGIYAAECATKADQYADDKNNRSAGRGNPKRMFLTRMVLGHSYVCTDRRAKQFRRPPCKTCLKDDCKDAEHMSRGDGHTYDSVVGDNNKLFREFVVYDSSLCYPEYLITYERR